MEPHTEQDFIPIKQGFTNSSALEQEIKSPTSSAAAVKLLTPNCDLPVGTEEKENSLTKINKREHYCGLWKPPQPRSGGESAQNEF